MKASRQVAAADNNTEQSFYVRLIYGDNLNEKQVIGMTEQKSFKIELE
jgi:hypothetical protein